LKSKSANNEEVLREGDRGAELFQLKNLHKNIFPLPLNWVLLDARTRWKHIWEPSYAQKERTEKADKSLNKNSIVRGQEGP